MSVDVGVGIRPLGVRVIFAKPVGLLLVLIKRAIPDEIAVAGEQDLIPLFYLLVVFEGRFVDHTRVPSYIGCSRLALQRFEFFHSERFTGLIPTPKVLKIQRFRLILEIFVLVELLATRFKSTAQPLFHQQVVLELWNKEAFWGDIPRLGEVHVIWLFVLLKEEKGQSCAYTLVYFTAFAGFCITGVEYLPQPVRGERLEKKPEVLDRVSDSLDDPIPFLTYARLLVIVPISNQKLPVARGENATVTVEIAVTISGHVYRICIIACRLQPKYSFRSQGCQQRLCTQHLNQRVSITVITLRAVEENSRMVAKRGTTRQDLDSGQNSEYNQPHRKTPYTTISVTPEVRDGIRDLRDDLGYETYGGLFRHIIQNAQEDLSTE